MRLVICAKCACSAPGGEWESGRKFCQAVSKFCRVCMLMEFPADHTEVLDWVGRLKTKKQPSSTTLRAKQVQWMKKNSWKTSDLHLDNWMQAPGIVMASLNYIKIIYRPERTALIFNVSLQTRPLLRHFTK